MEGFPKEEARAATDDQRGDPLATHYAGDEARRHHAGQEARWHSVLRKHEE